MINLQIIKQLPALQVLIPLFGALCTIIAQNRNLAHIISVIAVFVTLIISIILFQYVYYSNSDSIFYQFGGWEQMAAIEYSINPINQSIHILINIILLILLLFNSDIIDNMVIKHIKYKRQNLFYSVILFAHLGYLGIISTNDLFNLYVFIEISSLATYVLLSQGNNSKAVIGAFDYLILGTIGASFILISIGFLLGLSGNLNMSVVSEFIDKNYSDALQNSKLFITSILFFVVGVMLKTALFPMHFWMRRLYSNAPPIILTYLAPVSASVSMYVLLKFLYFVIGIEHVKYFITLAIKIFAISSIVICSWLATKQKKLIDVIIYSSLSQVGYMFLLISMNVAGGLFFIFILLDALSKFGLLAVYSNFMSSVDSLNNKHKLPNIFKILLVLILLFSCGLPMSATFIVKLKILTLLVTTKEYVSLFAIIISTIFALIYHFDIAKKWLFTNRSSDVIYIPKSQIYGLILIVSLQTISLFYVNNIISLY